MMFKTLAILAVSGGLVFGAANYESPVIDITYEDYYALANGHRAEQKLARSLMLYAWYRSEQQCMGEDKAIYQLNDLYIPINCDVRNRYFNLPETMQVQHARNELP